jgi:hypothetical protein
MEVQCENELQKGILQIDPIFDGKYLFGDIVLLDLCTISCIIDGINNSFYEYPQSATVSMK